MSDGPTEALRLCVDGIESSYEFMLAYAAQGRDLEDSGGAGPSIRKFLIELSAALEQVAGRVADCNAQHESGTSRPFTDYGDVLKQDAARARMAVELVLAVPSISSQLIDNLNASMHLRTLLTDLFLIDEGLKALAGGV